MRGFSLVAVVVLLASALAVVAPASAQAGAPFVEDAQNDVRVVGGFTGQGAPFDHGETAPVDLKALELVESDDALDFTLAVRGLQSNVMSTVYIVSFDFRDVSYSVVIQAGRLDAQYVAYLRMVVEEENFRFTDTVAELDVTVDTGSSTLRVIVPKLYLLDSDGKGPIVGDNLRGIAVRTNAQAVFSGFILYFEDRMPDTGDAGSLNLSKGGFASGHLVLSSDDPFRVSNGGSNTFVVLATLRNTGPIDDEAVLTVENIPDGWNVTVPKRVKTPAQSDTFITALVTLPFAHEHGGVSEFTLKATSEARSDAVTTLKMGVLHTPIPQPTGHHSELFLHANETTSTSSTTLKFGNGGSRLGMNTEADHAQDVAFVTPTSGGGQNGLDGVYTWDSTLTPGLALGIDFDLNQVGSLTTVVTPALPGEAMMHAMLYLVTENDWELIAEGESARQPVQGNSAATFTFDVAPDSEYDYIPYQKGQNLMLRIQFLGPGSFVCCNEQDSPKLSILDTVLKLPLNEYRDLVTSVDAIGPKLELSTDGPLEKKSRPGALMTYSFNVTNNGKESDEFVADVAGSDADRGYIVPTDPFTLGPGETRAVTLAVQLPYDGNDGQSYEVILLVRSQADPGNMALARTFTTLTFGDGAQPDETQKLLEAQGAEQDTPGFEVAALMVSFLVAAALVGRRRRA